MKSKILAAFALALVACLALTPGAQAASSSSVYVYLYDSGEAAADTSCDWYAKVDQPSFILVDGETDLRPVGRSFIQYRIADLSREAGVLFRPHDLRRTYGHRLNDAGILIETIARLMRHENINQAFWSYIGIVADELRRAQDRIG